MDYKLTCCQCGNGFTFHRVKKICSPECALERQRAQNKAWIRAHPEVVRIYSKHGREKVKARLALLNEMLGKSEPSINEP